jgi:hypothetical protein
LKRKRVEMEEEGGKRENSQLGENGRRRGEWNGEVGDGGIKCDRDRNGNGNIGGLGMTLICGTKGEGKERLVRKRKEEALRG